MKKKLAIVLLVALFLFGETISLLALVEITPQENSEKDYEPSTTLLEFLFILYGGGNGGGNPG